MVPPLRILHTSDLHGSLTEERILKLRALRCEVDLWFDCGDAVGIPRAKGLTDEPALVRLALAGCDAMTPGNHEFVSMGSDPNGATPALNLICANLFRRSGDPVFPPYALFRTPAGPVAVVGITLPWVKGTERPLRRLAMAHKGFVENFELRDPFEAAQKTAAEVRGRAETIIVLSHLGSRGDTKLARSHPKIDLILGGHTHEETPPTRIEGVPYAQTGQNGRLAGLYQWDGRELTGRLVPL